MPLTSADYSRFASSYTGLPQNTRCILGQSGTALKEVSRNWWGWKNWTLFGPHSAGIEANKAIVADFKRALKAKYGDEIANFAFPSDHVEGASLTVHTIQQVLKKAHDYSAQEMEHEALAVTLKIEATQKILEEIKTQLNISGKKNLPRFKKETPEVMQLLCEADSNPVEQSVEATINHSKEAQGVIAKMQAAIRADDFGAAKNALEQAKALSSQAAQDCKTILSIQGGVTDGVVNNVSTEEKKTPVCDDFPEPSFYGKLLGDIHQKRCDLWEKTYSSYQSTQSPLRATLGIPLRRWTRLPKCGGLTGLSNPTGNCGINSSLQLVRTALAGIRDHGSPEEWTRLSSNVKSKMPYLFKFLQNQLSTEQDCRELHKETARALAEDFWYSRMSNLGIARAELEQGHFYGSLPTSVVSVLLHRLEVPPLCFEQIESAAKQTVCHRALQVFSLDNNTSLSSAPINNLIKRQLTRQGRKLDDPVPSTLCIAPNKCAVNAVLQPITLPHKNGSLVTYEPKSIECTVYHEGTSHSLAFVKTQGVWHEVNDNGISPVSNYWEKDLEIYCSQNATTIIYEKKQAESNDFSPAEMAVPTSQKANIKAIGHEKEYSFLKTEDHRRFLASGAAMTDQEREEIERLEQEAEKASQLTVHMSSPVAYYRQTKAAAINKQNFWTQRIARCKQGLLQASEAFKPYWERSLAQAKAQERS